MRPIPSFATCAASAAALLAVVVVPAAPVFAQGVTYNGALTTASPTFNRPVANGNLAPTTLSASGTSVYYSVQAFYVNTTGGYNFLVTATGFDPYLSIYQNSFLPTSALTNGVASNDDFPSLTLSGFASLTLTANVQYFAVTNAFSNGATGTFVNNIGTTTRPTNSVVTLGVVGAGSAAAPEPGTIALALMGGVPVAGLVLRRRKARH